MVLCLGELVEALEAGRVISVELWLIEVEAESVVIELALVTIELGLT